MTPRPLPTAHDLAACSLAAQHPLTRSWVDEATRLEQLAEEHAFDLQLATDLDLAAGRAEFLGVGQPPEAFLNRWVEVRPDLRAMLSIRFERLDPARPFVDVSVTSRPLVPADVPALKDAAEVAYRAFHPPRLRLWSAEPLDGWPARLPGARPDLRVLAAPLTEVRAGQVPEGLTLAPTRDTSRHAEAARAYAALDAAHPDHTRQARLLSEEDLQEVLDEGTMFDVLWQGEWGGYAGALAETKLGLPAYVVQELLLTLQARGQGLGTHLSTLLARALPEEDRVLLGTVHGENLGARQAALRAGRYDVGGWTWVPLG